MIVVGLYIHHKTGNVYRVVATAINADNAAPAKQRRVHYRNAEGQNYDRVESEFEEIINGKPRFEKMWEEHKDAKTFLTLEKHFSG
jgi:hypothetical protein